MSETMDDTKQGNCCGQQADKSKKMSDMMKGMGCFCHEGMGNMDKDKREKIQKIIANCCGEISSVLGKK
ncbi:MAG: hypothetical protein NT082_02565 [Chloroflexi bacterium]|nr:hypothetical protein [Chloroflexota bacterium]